MAKKTVFMPKKLFDKWIRALRGEGRKKFKQGDNALVKTYADGEARYCCLGVLEAVADGKVEDRSLPSLEWLENHNVLFVGGDGITDNDPALGKSTAADMNDDGKSFRQIATALKRAYGGPIKE